MGKTNTEIGKAQTITEQQIAQARALQEQSKGFQDYATGRADKLFGQQQNVIDQYSPQLQALMLQLQGQLPGLETAAKAPVTALDPNAKQLSEGYSPETLAALTGQAIDQVPGRYDAQASALKAMLGSRGMMGGFGGSGDVANQFGNLYAAKEAERAAALRGITTGNEALKNQNIEANRQFNLGNLQAGLGAKQATFQDLLATLTGGQGLYNTQLGTMATTAGLYDPNAFLSAASGALGQQNAALGTAGEATGQRANLLQKSWVDQYMMPVIGAGIGAVGSVYGAKR